MELIKRKISIGFLKCPKPKWVLIAFTSFVIQNGCYTVNDRTTLNIGFSENKLNADYLIYYIDKITHQSTRADSLREKFFDRDTIPNDTRIVSLNGNPDEFYLVVFDASPCWIESVYNPKLSDYPITHKIFLPAGYMTKIKQSFEKEMLKKAEEYGKTHHVPDSIMYTR